MSLRHKVTINVAKPNGENSSVIQSTRKTIRTRMLDFLFGKKASLLVITPGDSVETVEIKEIKEGGVGHE
ncbi:hypothetical protein [Enterococcus cecorum]|uniref:hypothetical protein n=1 Tax=Enterococcus cecorum TaxID=44008 RepID=UPI0006431BB3|nr:hypothetical protein [Enterococcus cecorum]KLO69115.1 hypothetical protein AA987_09420 [Enterococcus cecorum]CAI3298432.1 hypothetical protein CIRMBP1207_00652 [Enterococcus cecorum]CAI3333551.1 hypothetical protein CIRMBP1212_00983 [Enterococcus cecorum]CAI3350643.1 hypothetical protein CIRMBP1214_01140 [Enterococcus cecorum]CAI3442685.1 hypothetical protein CIRMBP1319_01384 [Enterococcus cecorum]